MRVKVLFFGMLKDIVGRSEEQLDIPENGHLRGIFEHWRPQLAYLGHGCGETCTLRGRAP